jgi:hypothetical protein
VDVGGGGLVERGALGAGAGIDRVEGG